MKCHIHVVIATWMPHSCRYGAVRRTGEAAPAPDIAVLVMPAVQQVLRLAQMNRPPD
jgi:hypothetical protein